MKTGKKLILWIFLSVLFIVASAAGGLYYGYTHPALVMPLVTRSLSRAANASVAVRNLSYSIHPLNIAAEGITLQPRDGAPGWHLEIPEFHAEFAIEGPFGRRRLHVNRLEVKGPSCRLSHDAFPSGPADTPRTASFLGAMLKNLIAFFLFRDIQLNSAAMLDGAMVAQFQDQMLHVSHMAARLNPDRGVELTGDVQFEWPQREMGLLAPGVQIRTDRMISLSDLEIRGSVVVNGAQFKSPAVDIRDMRAGAALAYWPGTGQVTFDPATLVLDEAEIQEGGSTEIVRLGMNLTATGAFSLKDRALTARPLHLAIGKGLLFQGGLEAALGAAKTIALDSTIGQVTPQELIPILPSVITRPIGSLRLGGQVPFSGRIRGVEEASSWTWDADIEVRLERNQVSFSREPIHFGGVLTGEIQARGRIPDVSISADIRAGKATVSGKGMDVKPFEASVSLSGTYPVFELKGLSVQIPGAGGRFREKLFRADDIQVQAREGRVNVAARSVSLPKVRFDSSLLKNITASFEAEDGRPKLVEIHGKETGLATVIRKFDLFAPDWKWSGGDALQIQARWDGDGGVSIVSELAFQDMDFQDGDAACVGEKVSLKTCLNGKMHLPGSVVEMDVTVNADQGEVLWDRFYLNLKGHPLSSRLKGRYTLKGSELRLSDLSVRLKDILTCRMDGRLWGKEAGWQADLAAEIPKLPLKPLFDFLIAEPFRAERPLLSAIGVEGTVSATLRLKGLPTDWDLQGDVQWNNGEVRVEEKGISLQGIDLSLPVWARHPEAANSLSEAQPMPVGRLSIGSARFPLIPEQGLTFLLEGGPNRLSLTAASTVKIPGGDVRLGPVVIRGLTGPSPSLGTDLAVDRVGMGPLLADIWGRPVEGTISGRLNPIDVVRGDLTTRGTLTARAFGGEIVLSDVGVSGLLAGTPVFKVNARWKDLDLSKLTADTAFGRIEGVLNGHAEDVEIAQGQVQRFDLLLETVRKEGVPQRISVRAVDNIAQIGGGQSPFIGVAGMFAAAFKEFPYEKIGVRATLENDVFRINGTVREGGTEYLVKRGFISGVNVVNQNPDNRVSFKDMIKRIQRIKTSKGGPVIQ